MQANPVIVKELRGRMRGWRAAGVLSLYLVVLSGVTLLFYMFTRTTAQYSYNGTEAAQIGRGIFGALVVFQTIMVSLLTPGFTAGSITSEREQKTYDLLMTTLLPPRSVIFGKLGSALAYVVLLIIAIAPLESLAFMFGGVSPEEIILSQVVMLAAALLFASVGMFWSSMFRSSVGSNVITYGTLLFLLVGVPLLYSIIVTTMTIPSINSTGTPITQTVGFVYISGVVLSSNPLVAMALSDTFLLNGDPLFIYNTTKLLNGRSIFVVSPWLIFCLEAAILSILLIAVAIRAVRPTRYIATPSYAQAPVELPAPGEEADSVVEELSPYTPAGAPPAGPASLAPQREQGLPPPPPPPAR